MGQIIGLDGQPLKSEEEIKNEADAKEITENAIKKMVDFKTPASIEKAMAILNKNGYGYCIVLINKTKTATQVHHNINHPNAGALIQQTIHNHFSTTKQK